MPASYCPFCKKITLIDYNEFYVGDEYIVEIVCRVCNRTLSRDWRKIKS